MCFQNDLLTTAEHFVSNIPPPIQLFILLCRSQGTLEITFKMMAQDFAGGNLKCYYHHFLLTSPNSIWSARGVRGAESLCRTASPRLVSLLLPPPTYALGCSRCKMEVTPFPLDLQSTHHSAAGWQVQGKLLSLSKGLTGRHIYN